MALVITPAPGNRQRVTCSGCSEGLTLTGFALAEVKAAVEVVSAEHVCSESRAA